VKDKKKIRMVSLGCARNLSDAEVMLGGCVQDGWQVTSSDDDADAVVINTCAFIGPAKEESIDTILEYAQLKTNNPQLKLVVSGCLTQRYKTQLAKGFPEVDFFIGTDEFVRLPELLATPPAKGEVIAKRKNYLYEGELPKLNTMGQLTAYVKVAEGCDHSCAFCIIPAIRGKLRSRPIQSVIKEIENLVAAGVMEVNLIAQDLAAYGRDRGSEGDLLELLAAIEAIDGLRWARMLYVYPEHISDAFCDFLAKSQKIVPYIDIPSQHGSDRMLKTMNRNVTANQMLAGFRKLREARPDVAIRSTVMVGFPGESDEDFAELCDFVKQASFDHLGCFAYSKEEGTVAGRMKDQIDEDIKKERYEQIMSLQAEVQRDQLERKYLDKVVEVLVFGLADESELLLKGRLATQAPDVDGQVLINEGRYQGPGLYKVRIHEVIGYDLLGEIKSPLVLADKAAKPAILKFFEMDDGHQTIHA
jgi:ribosomal protein S12 methylthiotransferase